mgnify:CR=1 FL=1
MINTLVINTLFTFPYTLPIKTRFDENVESKELFYNQKGEQLVETIQHNKFNSLIEVIRSMMLLGIANWEKTPTHLEAQ